MENRKHRIKKFSLPRSGLHENRLALGDNTPLRRGEPMNAENRRANIQRAAAVLAPEASVEIVKGVRGHG